MLNFKQYDFKRYSIPLIVTVLVLGCIGAYLIKQVQADDENLFLKHILGLGVGIIGAMILSLIDYHFITGFYIVLYVINLVLLVLVKVNGVTINHAKRWLDLGFTQLQPSELTKIILILFAAKIFSMFRAKINNFFFLVFAAISIGLPTFLILIQTNLSTSIVIAIIFLTMLFAAGLSWKVILPVLVIGIPCIMGLFWYVQQDYQVLLKDYQQQRILSILNPDEYEETMFQQDNSVGAIASGQLYGKVFSEEEDRNYDHIPISESDFIFSVAGEEFGFIGSCLILALYAVIIYICLMTAKQAPDYMGMLISVGIASMFVIQVFVNVGVTTKLLPNTGIPLPFMSSGLSSMLSGMLAVGILLNIRLQPKKTRIERA
jgi:rod shape determining protein RodA